jgi:hypothetical protein
VTVTSLERMSSRSLVALRVPTHPPPTITVRIQLIAPASFQLY